MIMRYFPDVAVILRVLLAGLLTLLVSFYFDLPRLNWALLSIALLGFRVDLGGIYVKSLARIGGTLAGGITGIVILVVSGQDSLLLIILLSVVLWICITFASSYGAMAGYTSFLAYLTCTVVVLLNLTTSSAAKIGNFAIVRITEISLGAVALLVSSLIIWPTSSQDRLISSIAALRSHIAELAQMAQHPEQYPYPVFVALHTRLNQMVIDTDQQRYYTLFLDSRIGHLSGYLQRVILSVLNLMGSLTMLRRILIRQQYTPQQELVIKRAIAQEARQLDSELEQAIYLLTHPAKIRQQEAETSYDTLLDLQNWRATLYYCMAAVLALVTGFFFWLMTATPDGPLVALGAVVITGIRVLSRSQRMPLAAAVKAVLISTAVVFVTQYVLLPYIDNFWLLFVLTIVPISVATWSIYRNKSATGLLATILTALMMPVANEQPFLPLELFNRELAVLVGFIIGYFCIELVGTPPRGKLCQDYQRALVSLLRRTMNQNSREITPPQFRLKILPLGFEMLALFPDEQVHVLNWMDTLASMGSTSLKLRGLNDDPRVCDQAKAIFDQARHQMSDQLDHLHLPTAAMTSADRERQQQLDNLFDQAFTLYEQRQLSHNLNLLIFCGCLRRHHQVSFTDGQVQW